MNSKVAKKLRQHDRRLRRDIDKQLHLNMTEVLKVIEDEWTFAERLRLLFPKTHKLLTRRIW